MSAPLVLGIAGSPRRGGNSEQMLEACLTGAEESGARTVTLVPSELSIRPCLGCNACSLTGECVQHDGMLDVYPLIDAAAAIVVASPVFFATVPATLKLLIDRMQPYWARAHVLGLPAPAKRPGGILLARGGGDPYGYTGAENTIRSVFAVLGVRVVAEEKIAGVDGPDDIAQHPDVLGRARTCGVAIVAAVRSAAG